ncbi:GNAT family N-acetyltransferase [Paenibacillus mendelii]|uniref:GNAT family N-acetyltransferase n=1 Tax=Paenibacillus mendelii TaxID=206163 RepID=A0ABV6JEC9_9BACL|nr:GNAT family N-acetyltransferase [Paenibacillus mendelii]MCQ6557142.1 GNAT family N-acetyltransferase [Paenibacillus mendelii]
MNSILSTMRLETERLVIQPYIASDLIESYELMQDPELFTYMHMSVMTLEEYKGLFDWLIESYNTPFDQPFKYSFAIRSLVTGAFVGWCGVGVLEFSAPDNELYYLIGRDYWGNGYATEAAQALTAYAFEVIGLDSLYAKADSQNAASLRILTKLGFEFESVLTDLPDNDQDCNGELKYVLTKERLYSMDSV